MELKFFLIGFVLSLGCCHAAVAQNRQPDSLRVKQIAYNELQRSRTQKFKDSINLAKYRQANAAVVSYDSKGNKVEKKNNADGTVTITTTIKPIPTLNRKFSIDTLNLDSIVIKVVKSKYRLNVYHKGKILTAFKCVFGPNMEGQKMQEGDRRTPEGVFTITEVRKHDKWEVFMLLDFPNDASRRNFDEMKKKGLVSDNARIGGNIGIHGVWFNGDNVIDLKHNWTDGCISLKNDDILELQKLVKPGYTRILIAN